MKSKDVIYIADIDQDIDDIIAADYLHSSGRLMGVVLDPLPISDLGKQRVEKLKEMGIEIFEEVPECNYVFVGGAFTKLAKYLESHFAVTVVANGGSVS